MKFILDTDICIYLIKSKSSRLIKKLINVGFGQVGISSITFAELQYGVEKSLHKKQNAISLLRFVSSLDIENFDDNAAIIYGEIRADLEREGNMIGPMDTLIAAHTKSLGATLVTNNTKEFNRVPGLCVENWC